MAAGEAVVVGSGGEVLSEDVEGEEASLGGGDEGGLIEKCVIFGDGGLDVGLGEEEGGIEEGDCGFGGKGAEGVAAGFEEIEGGALGVGEGSEGRGRREWRDWMVGKLDGRGFGGR